MSLKFTSTGISHFHQLYIDLHNSTDKKGLIKASSVTVYLKVCIYIHFYIYTNTHTHTHTHSPKDY